MGRTAGELTLHARSGDRYQRRRDNTGHNDRQSGYDRYNVPESGLSGRYGACNDGSDLGTGFEFETGPGDSGFYASWVQPGWKTRLPMHTPSHDEAGNGVIRSALFVPGDSERKLAKGMGSGADALFIDLEDSVALDRKPEARKVASDFLQSVQIDRPAPFVRVNAFETGMTDDDLAAVMVGRPAGIVLPKSLNGADVQRLDALLRVHEMEHGIRDGATQVIAIATETASAVFGAGTYGGSSRRLNAMTWGAEDLAADIGTERQRDERGRYTDLFRYARTQCLLGATAAGVQAMDTVYPDFRDEAGFKAECEAAAADGFTGKMAIHPAQVPVINAAFTPSKEAIARAEAVIAAFEEAGNPGVVAVNGAMLDGPHLRKAQALLARAGG